jgi:hypothetical protein
MGSATIEHMFSRDHEGASTLVLRLVDSSAAGLRVRVIEVGATDGERVLGVVTTPAAAAALVRGWLEASVEQYGTPPIRRPPPAQDSAG